MHKIIEATDKLMDSVINNGIQNANNLDSLYKLIDIQKDAYEIECMKEDKYMRYNNYGRYDDSYGRYDDSYGRRMRDSRGRYAGYGHIDNIYENYGRYEEGREQYGRGDYNAKNDSIKSLEYMLKSVVSFMEMLKKDADTKEEQQIIDHYTRKISEM